MPRRAVLAAFLFLVLAVPAGATRVPFYPPDFEAFTVFSFETVEAFRRRLAETVRMADCGRDGLDAEDVRRVVLARQAMAADGRPLPGACFSLPRTREWERDGLIPGAGPETAVYGSPRAKPFDYVRLLGADPSGDRRLTYRELDSLASRSFREMDVNQDGKVDDAETAAARLAACNWPKPRSGDRIIMMGMLQSEVLSAVSLMGQDGTTHFMKVHVDEGRGSLYLIGASYESMIWEVSGAVHRISGFVVSSEDEGEAGAPAVGVIGVPKARVHVLSRNYCIPYFYQGEQPEQVDRATARVETVLGRGPDLVVGAYQATVVSLPSGAWTMTAGWPGIAPRKPPPPGFDKTAWDEGQRFWSGGLAYPRASTIVAKEVPQSYQVLPAQFGLSQLVAQGRLEQLPGNSYRVLKPLPRYPAGLAGAHMAQFFFPPDIPEPPGHPGHSQILDSETGRPRGEVSPVCREPEACGS